MFVSMSVTGLSGLLSGLLGVAAKVVPAAGVAVGASAEVLKESMQAEMPVLTGFMRDSTTITHSGLSAEVGPTAPYSGYVNWGTYKDAPQDFIEVPAEVAADDLAVKVGVLGVAF